MILHERNLLYQGSHVALSGVYRFSRDEAMVCSLSMPDGMLHTFVEGMDKPTAYVEILSLSIYIYLYIYTSLKQKGTLLEGNIQN